MSRRFPLAAKLVLGMLFTAAVPVSALVGLGLFLQGAVRADVEQKVESTLDLAMNTEAALLDESLLSMKQTAAAVSRDPAVAGALAGAEGRPDLGPLAQAFPRADMLVVVDRDGRVVARSSSPRTGDRVLLDGLVAETVAAGAPQAYPELISPEELQEEGPQIHALVDMPVLATSQSADSRAGGRVETALALVGTAPVRADDGSMLGVVIAADVLNRDFRLVDEVARLSPPGVPVNATIAMDGIRVTTTVRLTDPEGNPTDQRALGTLYSDVVMRSLRGGLEYRGRAPVVGQWQRTVYRPLTDHRGQVVAGPYVGIPEAYFTALGSQISRWVAMAIWGGGGALAVVFLGGLWLSHRGIVAPLRRFARHLQSRSLDARILHPADDEVGDLARALDDMLGRVREGIEEMRTVAGEVGQASQGLHDAVALTRAETERALANASCSLEAARELGEGAERSIARLRELEQAVAMLAEGAGRQERSVGYTGMVVDEVAASMAGAREQMDGALEEAAGLAAGARASLRRAAELTAAALLGSSQVDRQDPSELLAGMAAMATQLAAGVRALGLTLQENQARLAVVREEIGRVGAVVAATAESNQQSGATAAEVGAAVERMAERSAAVAEEALSIRNSVDRIARANISLEQMSGQMLAQAARLRQTMARLGREQ